MKTIDRSKIRLSTLNNGQCWTLTDSNRSRRLTAEIIKRRKDGRDVWNVRIDKAGEPYRYAADVPTETPEAAYEYALEFGLGYPEALELFSRQFNGAA